MPTSGTYWSKNHAIVSASVFISGAGISVRGPTTSWMRSTKTRVIGAPGLTLPEIAKVLGVSLTTVEKEWRRARAWLAVELGA